MSERKINTSYNPKPIPVRGFDWCATFDDYEPGDAHGYGATKEAAIADLWAEYEAKKGEIRSAVDFLSNWAADINKASGPSVDADSLRNIAELLGRLEDVAKEMLADHMTSEKHHPGYVLVPVLAFNKLCAIRGSGEGSVSTPSGKEVRVTAMEGGR